MKEIRFPILNEAEPDDPSKQGQEDPFLARLELFTSNKQYEIKGKKIMVQSRRGLKSIGKALLNQDYLEDKTDFGKGSIWVPRSVPNVVGSKVVGFKVTPKIIRKQKKYVYGKFSVLCLRVGIKEADWKLAIESWQPVSLADEALKDLPGSPEPQPATTPQQDFQAVQSEEERELAANLSKCQLIKESETPVKQIRGMLEKVKAAVTQLEQQGVYQNGHLKTFTLHGIAEELYAAIKKAREQFQGIRKRLIASLDESKKGRFAGYIANLFTADGQRKGPKGKAPTPKPDSVERVEAVLKAAAAVSGYPEFVNSGAPKQVVILRDYAAERIQLKQKYLTEVKHIRLLLSQTLDDFFDKVWPIVSEGRKGKPVPADLNQEHIVIFEGYKDFESLFTHLDMLDQILQQTNADIQKFNIAGRVLYIEKIIAKAKKSKGKSSGAALPLSA